MEFLIAQLLMDAAVGFGIGVAIGLTGVGGGALVQPALIHLLGLAPVAAVGTGLLYAMVTKAGGAVSHWKLGTIRRRRAYFLLLGSVPAVLASSKLVNLLVDRLGAGPVNNFLQLAIALVLIGTAVVLILQAVFLKERMARNRALHTRTTPLPLKRKVTAVLCGIVIGILIGATSIGGGVLIIPAMLIFLDSNANEAIGTSIAISLVLSGLGGLVYLWNGQVLLLTVLFLCLGSLPGVFLGSRLSTRVPDSVLKLVVIILVILSGLSLFFKPGG